MGFHWEKYIYFSCWEIDPIHWECLSQYGKIYGKLLGLLWDFVLVAKLPFHVGKSIPCLGNVYPNTGNIMGICWDLFGILLAPKILNFILGKQS